MSNKRKGFRRVHLIELLIVILSLILAIAIYVYFNPQAITPKVQNVEMKPQSQQEATSLPAELTDYTNILVLVDKTHALPQDYKPNNLTNPYINSTADQIWIREDIVEQAKNMVNAAQAEGITLYAMAGYRSYQEQQDLYNDRVDKFGEASAGKVVAKAGHSENQTGLAIDFTDSPTGTSSVSFAQTAAGQWLYAHAHEYGFILRYPENKEAITGYSYLPWHYRYVGVDVANAMYEKGGTDYTFEEYYQIQK